MGKPAETDRRPLKSLSHSFTLDFIVTGRSKDLLEREIKPLIEQVLREGGLELSPTNTVITDVITGFDFLGQNVRRYPDGKRRIKPSKKNVRTFLGHIRRIIKAALGSSAADLIKELNPKIRGWVNYHRHTMTKSTFARVDHEIFCSLWRWARRRHRNKPARWRKKKYFAQHGGQDWSFFGEVLDDDGRPSNIWLLRASSTPIKRHIKIQGDANPYDPAYEIYFEKREEAHMRESFRGTRILR